MSLQIRRATLNDIEIIAILFDAYRVWYKQPPDITEAEIFLKERIQNNESLIFIAFDKEKAVGFTQLYPIFSSVSMRKAWLLNDLYVTTNSRGKGIGTALLNKAKEYGAETNAKWLMLQTGKDNFNAQSVYEKNGWIKETDLFYTVLT